MKHEATVTKLLITIFILSQLLGLFLLALDAQVFVSQKGISVDYSDTAIGERPDFQGLGSLLYLTIGVAVGTAVLLFLIKLKVGKNLWKVWYTLAVVIAIMLSLGVVFSQTIAFLLAVVLAYLKLKRPNMLTHNLTELLMYAGLAILLVPLFDVFWAGILLVLISIYDAIAVWKSKHMVDLATFTTESNLFAGLMVNYKTTKGKTKLFFKHEPAKKKGVALPKPKMEGKRQAILGGGDIVFPLIFSGTVLIWLLELGYSKFASFGLSLIITLGATGALAYLFVKAEKDKFYPAMPFLSTGCFLGFIVLLTLLLAT
ncbi:MAG: hypothetical protein KC535_01045 [Nanoarchaeota archaeon]|nr:hypothetical protein [Nanoarchaeota archaeon]